MSNRQIIAVGDLVWDVLTKPNAPLLPGGDISGRIALAPGGSAANLATWVVRSGMPAGFVGKVGADVMGDLLCTDMEREGVTAYLTRDPDHDTGVILVLIDRDGQRSMVTNQGADFRLLPEELPKKALESAACVHITAWSLFTDPPRAAAIRAAQIGRAAGARVSLDPASYQMINQLGVAQFYDLIEDMPIDIIFPNRDEGRALTGRQDPERIAQDLRARFPGVIVVLKLDKDGCYVLADDHAAHYSAQHVNTIDATGAGDAFDGAFLAHFHRSGDLAAAAQYANAIGSWVVAHYGARPAPDEQLRAILHAYNAA